MNLLVKRKKKRSFIVPKKEPKPANKDPMRDFQRGLNGLMLGDYEETEKGECC